MVLNTFKCNCLTLHFNGLMRLSKSQESPSRPREPFHRKFCASYFDIIA